MTCVTELKRSHCSTWAKPICHRLHWQYWSSFTLEPFRAVAFSDGFSIPCLQTLLFRRTKEEYYFDILFGMCATVLFQHKWLASAEEPCKDCPVRASQAEQSSPLKQRKSLAPAPKCHKCAIKHVHGRGSRLSQCTDVHSAQIWKLDPGLERISSQYCEQAGRHWVFLWGGRMVGECSGVEIGRFWVESGWIGCAALQAKF